MWDDDHLPDTEEGRGEGVGSAGNDPGGDEFSGRMAKLVQDDDKVQGENTNPLEGMTTDEKLAWLELRKAFDGFGEELTAGGDDEPQKS